MFRLLTDPFKNSYKVLVIASLPAAALTAFGLIQLGVSSPTAWVCTLASRLFVEFFFLALLLNLLNLIGVKNKWVLGILLFLYYLTLTADFTLLLYFKERFGAKYLETMEGGDYDFLTDWRVISYLLFFFLYAVVPFLTLYKKPKYWQMLNQISTAAVCLLLVLLLNPLRLLPVPNNFFAAYLMTPSPIYTLRALIAKQPNINLTTQPSEQIMQTAARYNVFTAKNTGIGKTYKRVIFIAQESLSGKYLHAYNPNIPAQATPEWDALLQQYPSTTLSSVTLSTLYGLSVIFSSHPFVWLNYTHDYPISLVKNLKASGYQTTFIRGADETYMDEHLLFQKAGFDSVIGSNYFNTRDDYKKYVDWWGLTDRKLFDYTVEYLKEHKDEKVFLTLLTVDTHVPLGRLDYLDHEYAEIEAEFYNVPTMPRAFARGGQDLAAFIKNLQEEGLLDPETIVFVTGDHPSFSNMPTQKLFAPYQKVFDRIPFVIITQNKLNKPLADGSLVSQLDIAPTILDLLDFPQQKGFFGHSLFDYEARRTIFDVKEDYAVVTSADGRQIVPLRSEKPKDKEIIDLIRTFWID